MQLQKSIFPIASLLFVKCLAAITSTPVKRHASYAQLDQEHERLTRFRWANCLGRANRQLTLGAHNDYEHTLQIVPVFGLHFWDYLVDISIGSPPQGFVATVDIGWTDLFVPSVNCSTRDCSNFHQYNSSQSVSYKPHLAPVSIEYNGLYTSGNISIDTLYVGHIAIQDQFFEEATSFQPVPFWEFGFESALGLSRLPMNSSASTLRVQSPFHKMISQKSLTSNKFSLKLPQSDEEQGELLFGATNGDLYEGDLKTMSIIDSVINSTELTGEGADFIIQMFASGWQVAAHAMSLQSRSDNRQVQDIIVSFTNCTAILQTAIPYIVLPSSITRRLLAQYPVDPFNPTIACSKRNSLPDLVIYLGPEKQAFTLTPFDYILEIPDLKMGSESTCTIPFAHLPPYQKGHPEYIILGSSFLHSWYSVFDYDMKTIGFAKLKM